MNEFDRRSRPKIFCNAIWMGALVLLSACATPADGRQYGAYGYLSPGLNSDPELIGVFDSKDACEEAAEAWETRQVVGNPIHAECYPASHD